MTKSKPLIDATGEVHELTSADLKRFRRAERALPKTRLTNLKRRSPQKAPTKAL